MKLQHLAVIFIIIMLPISLVISAYTQMQMDTLILQNQYDEKLMNATYDAVKAFDLNTSANNVSDVYDTVRQDIQAAVSTFMSSLATNMGVDGYQDEYIKPYIPAILFTLYDGYYIYAPTKVEEGYIYTLQPYNYYSVRYVRGNIDVVVNYSLDNYIVVYGNIGNDYVVRSGYLVAETQDITEKETIKEYLPVATWENREIQGNVSLSKDTIDVTNDSYSQGISTATGDSVVGLYPDNETYYIDPSSAKKYYADATDFTDWVEEKLGSITAGDAVIKKKKIFEGDNTHIFNIDAKNNNPEDSTSDFNEHRIAVIQNTIEDNLNYVITAYAQASGGNTPTYNFRMPQLDANEWVQIASNICMVSFVQGMPVGSRFYNNYAIVSSTTNKFFVDPENIYYVNTDVPENVRYYHKIDCPKLLENEYIQGFSNYNFQPFSIKVPNEDDPRAYYRHQEKACYYCIVGGSYGEIDGGIGTGPKGRNSETGELVISELDETRQKAYYTAVAREKYNQYKVTESFMEHVP